VTRARRLLPDRRMNAGAEPPVRFTASRRMPALRGYLGHAEQPFYAEERWAPLMVGAPDRRQGSRRGEV